MSTDNISKSLSQRIKSFFKIILNFFRNHKFLDLFIILIVLILFIVFLVIFHFNIRMNNYLNGSSINFTYNISMIPGRESDIYEFIKDADATYGEINGHISKDNSSINVYTTSNVLLFTDVFINKDVFLINVEKIYANVHDYYLKDHPILARLLPEWKLGDYISTKQLARITNTDFSGNSLNFKELFNFNTLKPCSYSGIGGYSYFETVSDDEQFSIIVGINRSTLLTDTQNIHAIIQENRTGLMIELKGNVYPSDSEIKMPESKINGAETILLRKIWNVIMDNIDFADE